ncbi:hypothetical protein QTP88_024698 [Uroleucon formosanum]
MGKHSNIIVPPSWIVKLPRKGNFKSSIRSPKKRSSKKKTKDKVRTSITTFEPRVPDPQSRSIYPYRLYIIINTLSILPRRPAPFVVG